MSTRIVSLTLVVLSAFTAAVQTTLAAPIGQLTNEQYNASTESAGNQSSLTVVTAGDLILHQAPISTNYVGNNEGAGGTTAPLTDGQTASNPSNFGNASLNPSEGTNNTNSLFDCNCGPNPVTTQPWYVEYQLPTAGAPKGWDLSAVTVYTGHQDSRSNQNYDILVSKDGVHFTSLSDGSAQPLGAAGAGFAYNPATNTGGAAESTVSPIGLTLGSGIRDVEFVALSGGADVYRELTVNGTQTVPEPSSFILGGLAAVGLAVAVRRRKASATVVALLLADTLVSAANANQIPIALTSGSFNNDVVVENTASNFAGAITGTMDGGAGSTSGDTWYQVGLGGNPGTGLPTGTTFTSAADANTSYALQSAVGNNVLLLNNGQSGTMTLATPGVYSSLTVLTSTGSAGSDTDLNYAIHYQNGHTQTGTIQSPDWFNSSPVAIGAGGRVSAGSPFSFDNQSAPGGNPNLYQENIGLTLTTSKIISIDFDKTGQNNNGNTAIWAVSGTVATLTPEPSSFVLAGLAAVGLAVAARRRRKA